jgi:protein ImuB
LCAAPCGPFRQKGTVLVSSVPFFFACHQAERDRDALLQLAIECEQFSPLVGLDEGDEPDGLRMDIRGLAKLFGGESSLAGRVAEFFQQRGYQVRISVADTPSAAAALARWGDGQGPCLIAPPGDRAALADLPVTALMLPEAGGTVKKAGPVKGMGQAPLLQHLGIYRLGQLQDLPRGSLAARFGPQLLQRLDRITGAADEVIVACREPADLTVQCAFEHPVTRLDAIEWAVQQLLVQLAPRLTARGLGVLQLECRLVCQNRQTREIRIGLFQPTVDPGHLLALIRMQLERLNSEPVPFFHASGAIQEIRIAAVSTAVREQRQGELFADAAPRDPAKLALLIERLSNRLGRERVLRPRLRADAQIERAYECEPLTGARPPRDAPAPAAGSRRGGKKTGLASSRNRKVPEKMAVGEARDSVSRNRGVAVPVLSPGPSAPGPMLRPLRLFDPPRPIDVVGIALDGPPAKFFDRNQAYRVACYFGPERIETGWWRGPSVRRDYYRVETTAGNRLWLFRQLQDQQWFLHGEFE